MMCKDNKKLPIIGNFRYKKASKSKFVSLGLSVEEANEFFPYVFVALSGEGFTAFFVATEWTDKVGVFDFLV